MSYALDRKCSGCEKKISCIDSTFIMGAIYGIHQANHNDAMRQAHLGSGEIVLKCYNFKDEKGTIIEEPIFKRNDIISIDNKTMHQCICADVDIAVFAPMDFDEKENSNVTHYKDMFVVGNLPSIIGEFKYKRIIGTIPVCNGK